MERKRVPGSSACTRTGMKTGVNLLHDSVWVGVERLWWLPIGQHVAITAHARWADRPTHDQRREQNSNCDENDINSVIIKDRKSVV